MRIVTIAGFGGLLCLLAPASADVVVNVSKSQQRLSVVVDGEEIYRWPVSTGRRGYETPDGVFHAKSMNEEWYSRQYEMTPMPHAVFFYQGYAVHGTLEPRNIGRAVSHGCVRLEPDNAATLFSLVREQGLENTKVVVSDRPLPHVRKASPAQIAKLERGAAEPPAAQAKQIEESPAAEPKQEAQERPAAKTADVILPVVAAKRAGEEVTATPKADREDVRQAPAARADRAELERPIVQVNREEKESRADQRERAAETPPAEPVQQEAIRAEPVQDEVRPPERAPAEVQQPEPAQEATLPEPVQQEIRLPEPVEQPIQPQAKLAEPAPEEVRLPEPAPHRRADTRYAAARGSEAEVLRDREAWLRGLAHKYGYSKW